MSEVCTAHAMGAEQLFAALPIQQIIVHPKFGKEP